MSDGSNEYRISKQTGTWLILASMLLNFFLLGLVVAPKLWPHEGPPPFGPPEHRDFIEHLVRELPAADAAKLRAVYAKDEANLTAGREGIDRGMAEISAALDKPVVDNDELQKAFDDVSASHRKIQEGMDDLIKHAASDLSPEGRHAFAEHGLRKPDGPPPGHRQPFGMGPPPGPPPEFH